jgi:uncharacterized protein (DUF885 family)
MTIGEQMAALRVQFEELNSRLFGLEGRVTAFERIMEQDRDYRKEVHKQILDNQADMTKRVGRLELKIAGWGGALLLMGVLLKLLDLKLLFK